jgi:hypothetical protein
MAFLQNFLRDDISPRSEMSVCSSGGDRGKRSAGRAPRKHAPRSALSARRCARLREFKMAVTSSQTSTSYIADRPVTARGQKRPNGRITINAAASVAKKAIRGDQLRSIAAAAWGLQNDHVSRTHC